MHEEGPFVRVLGRSARRRLYIKRDRKKVLDYMVELEVEVKGKWKAVVRYDPRHRGPHRDEHKLDGTQSKEYLDLPFDINLGYQHAVDLATRDIERNWARYQRRFLQGKWPK